MRLLFVGKSTESLKASSTVARRQVNVSFESRYSMDSGFRDNRMTLFTCSDCHSDKTSPYPTNHTAQLLIGKVTKMLAGIAIVFFGFTAAFIAAGAYWKLHEQETAHNKKVANVQATAETYFTEKAEELLTQGFKEGFEQAQKHYTAKPRGKRNAKPEQPEITDLDDLYRNQAHHA